MFPEVGKPRITEIQVRIDCNGCVQKIKKALHGINGIYDLYIDQPQQKVTVVGWADPEKIVKAIKKTRKVATICSHTEAPPDPPPQPAEPPPPPPPDQGAPPPEPDNGAPPEAAPPPPQPENPPPPQPENPPPETTPPPPPADPPATTQPPPGPPQASGPKDVEEIHVIHHHPPGLGNPSYPSSANYTWPNPNQPPYNYYSHGYLPVNNSYPISSHGHVYRSMEPSVHVGHSYNTYRPSPHITEYQYMAPPPPQHTQYHHYNNRGERYMDDHYSYHYRSSGNGDGNITSIFSDENPNACIIV